jgi:hypothetical protein
MQEIFEPKFPERDPWLWELGLGMPEFDAL